MTTSTAHADKTPTGLLHRYGETLERHLDERLQAGDENLDGLWRGAQQTVREYVMRPAKRVRPTLLTLGWLMARPQDAQVEPPAALLDFGMGLELLHAFMLVHDDVADRSPMRRGGPSLHAALGGGKLGDDLAVIAGDHLYARAVELLLSGSVEATRYMLEVCRHTAAGQHLDLVLAHTDLPAVTLFRTLKVADLKTAQYGFVAPLACGAMLAGGSPALIETLKRVGRHAGLAYQLRDDLLGLLGDDATTGKPGGADFIEGKRTFPVIAAWTRADAAGRAELEALWSNPVPENLPAARALLSKWGGLRATQKLIDARTRSAERTLEGLGDSAGTAVLRQLLSGLARRKA
jgi:geranylgeranyl diphosphate synthase type I